MQKYFVKKFFQLILCLVLFLTVALPTNLAFAEEFSLSGRCKVKSDCTPRLGDEAVCHCVKTSEDQIKCEDKDGNPTGTCLAKSTLNPNPTVFDPNIEFKSPIGTDNFADLICSITGFISDTILPPLAVLMTLVVGFLFLTSGGAPQRAGLAQKALLFTVAGVALLVLAPGIVVLIGDLFGDSAFKASLQASPGCQSITTGTIVEALLKTVNWFSWFVAITSVAMGLYSGFLYITARDNPQQVQQAAKVLSYVIIGVGVAILAFSIVAITRQLMGL